MTTKPCKRFASPHCIFEVHTHVTTWNRLTEMDETLNIISYICTYNLTHISFLCLILWPFSDGQTQARSWLPPEGASRRPGKMAPAATWRTHLLNTEKVTAWGEWMLNGSSPFHSPASRVFQLRNATGEPTAASYYKADGPSQLTWHTSHPDHLTLDD